MDRLLSILPLVGIALLFWLLVVRPARRRQSTVGQMQDQLTEGDQIMLTSGIYGRVLGLEAETLTLEVADGVALKVARGAVGQLVTSVRGDTSTFDSDSDSDSDSGLVANEPEEQ